MGLPLRDTQRHTYREYRTWPEDVRYELIDGVAYAMAPPVCIHQRLLGELYRQIADALEDSPCEVNMAPFDVRLPDVDESDDDILTAVQPDIVVVCDPDKLDTYTVAAAHRTSSSRCYRLQPPRTIRPSNSRPTSATV